MKRRTLGSGCALVAAAALALGASSAVSAPAFVPSGPELPGGPSSDLSHDGTTLVVGDPVNHRVRVYTRPEGGWGQPLGAPTTLQAEWNAYEFGARVAVSDDGSTIVISAPGAVNSGGRAPGAFYVFEGGDGWWSSRQRFVGAPTTVAISGDDATIAVGRSEGSVFVYTRSSAGVYSGTFINTLTALNLAGAENLSVSRDGLMVVAADSASPGAATAYIRPAEGWDYHSGEPPTIRLRTSGISGFAGFGTAVALSRDRSTIVVGAALESSDGEDDGALLVYQIGSGTGSHYPSAILKTSGSATGAVGHRVAISDDATTIASATRDLSSPAAGRVHVFLRERNGNWSEDRHQATTLTAEAPASGDGFGSVLEFAAGDARRLLVGDGTRLTWFAGTTTAPAVSVANLAGAARGIDGWHTEPVRIALDSGGVAGGSGFSEVRCAIDPPTAPASFDALPPGPCPYPDGLTFTATGRHSFYAAVSDALGNVSPVRGVTFALDGVPPDLMLPVAIQVTAPTPGGTNVQYSYSATDDFAGVVPVVCGPGPGAYFPVGVSTVRCSAVDQAGNTTTKSFTVTVDGEPLPGTQPRVEAPPAPAPADDTPGESRDEDDAPSRPRLSALALRGRVLTARVSTAATVRVEFARCRAPRGSKRAVTCRVAARLTARAHAAGAVRLALPTRLVAGRYRVTVRARGAGGDAAALVRTLTVSRRR